MPIEVVEWKAEGWVLRFDDGEPKVKPRTENETSTGENRTACHFRLE